MSHTRNLRITVALCVAAVAALASPSSSMATVCNQAGNGHPHDGTYVTTDGDRSPPARYTSDRGELGNGRSNGHDRAAERSPALSQCGEASGGGDYETLVF